MQIVIKTLPGLLPISDDAMLHLIELKSACVDCEPIERVSWLRDSDYEECTAVTPDIRKLLHFYETFFSDSAVYTFQYMDDNRLDGALIDVITFMGKEFFPSNQDPWLKVVTIPDDVDWVVKTDSFRGIDLFVTEHPRKWY
jgi:hypothetical protein